MLIAKWSSLAVVLEATDAGGGEVEAEVGGPDGRDYQNGGYRLHDHQS